MSHANTSGYAWGHKLKGCTPDAKPQSGRKGKSKALTVVPPPRTSEAEYVDAEPEAAAEPEVSISLTVSQLTRIWDALPIEEKGLAIQTALTAVRE